MQLRSDKHSLPGFRVPKPAVTCAVWSTLIVWCYRQCPLAVTNASCGRDIFASVIHLRTAAPNIKSNLQSQRVKKLIWIDLNWFAKSPAEIWLINISKAKLIKRWRLCQGQQLLKTEFILIFTFCSRLSHQMIQKAAQIRFVKPAISFKLKYESLAVTFVSSVISKQKLAKHFMVLLCRVQQRYVKTFIIHQNKHSHCFLN